MQPIKTGKDVSVMVWGAFSGALGRSDLVVMEWDLLALKHGYSSNSYLKILHEQIPQVYKPGLVFMQDNAPIHGAKKVKKYMQDMAVEVMEWPPYSPDLNPIEHLWFPLKHSIYKIHPDIELITGGKEHIQEELGKTLLLAWELIQDSLFDKLAGSMQKRCEALYKAKGWHTKY